MSFAIAAGVCLASCASLPDVSDEHYYQNFVKRAQAAEDAGLPVYWLGRGFEVGGLQFRGPFADDFGDEVEGGGMQMHYSASLEPTPSSVGATLPFDVTIYSQPAWDLVKNNIMSSQNSNVLRRTVSVIGHDAQLLGSSGGTRPLNNLRLVLPLDNVVIVALAAAGGPITPITGPLATPSGPDYSPFINNPDLLVQVMQNLRPYPQ